MDIVVGFDGTEPAFVALDWAAARAAQGPNRVEIVTVDAVDPFEDEMVDLSLGEAEYRLRDVAVDAEITTRRIAGRMPDALLNAAGTTDLLVIGAHRRRPILSALSGWRPLRTVVRSEVPVVVVPEDWAGVEGPILVGLDDDDSSAGAVEFAANEALAADGRLTLLHAWQLRAPTLDGSVALLPSPIEEKAIHRRILEDTLEHLSTKYPGLTVEANLVQDNPSAALLAAARRSSLLVIGTHHRGVLAGAFLGSVGQDTLIESRIPVCVVPAPAIA